MNKAENLIAIKPIKKLGAGLLGIIFKGRMYNKDVIIKLEKISKEEIENPYSPFNAIIKFDEFASKYPQYFMTLISYKIIKNCNYKHELSGDAAKNKHLKKFVDNRNKFTYCSQLVYEPILDGVLYNIYAKLSIQQMKNCIYQILTILYLLIQNNWTHCDTHLENIMFKKKGTKLQWYLIDYDTIYNTKWEFIKSRDYYFKQFMTNVHLGITYFLFFLLFNDFWNYTVKINKMITYKVLFKKLKKYPQYKELHNMAKYIKEPATIDNIVILLSHLMYPDIICDIYRIKESDYKQMVYFMIQLKKELIQALTHINKPAIVLKLFK